MIVRMCNKFLVYIGRRLLDTRWSWCETWKDGEVVGIILVIGGLRLFYLGLV